MGVGNLKVIHTLPLLVRFASQYQDIEMLNTCLSTLGKSPENTVVIYNQGILSEHDIRQLATQNGVTVDVIGDGLNVGIPQSRQAMFEYVWNKYPYVPYISEIHVDMAFPYNWYADLIEFLERTDEPMVCPGILTQNGSLEPDGVRGIDLNGLSTNLLLMLLRNFEKDEVVAGFVHPVIHKSEVLKAVGGYDTGFLIGKQGFEDDSLLLSYLYYMGIRTGWRPKCLLKSRVYHAYMAQRLTLENIQGELQRNVSGLFQQYGAYGFKHLNQLHSDKEFFQSMYEQVKAAWQNSSGG
ncbi:Rhodanese domain-containing protein [Alicyclobacillus hesperidum URH17-3-68]|nr:Rhodanese domain-containing protein [Alicyclobacillus hesperidum URH17-3-68]